MDQAQYACDLATVEAHVRRGEGSYRVNASVLLERNSHNNRRARHLLPLFEGTQALQIEHRDRLDMTGDNQSRSSSAAVRIVCVDLS